MKNKITHCKRGHEFTVENTYTSSKGYRHCKACRRIYQSQILFGGDNRELAIQRDGEKCVKCGMTRTEHMELYKRDITVDHIIGEGTWDKNSPVPNNDLSNLQTLCAPCHGKKDGPKVRSWEELPEERRNEVRATLARTRDAWNKRRKKLKATMQSGSNTIGEKNGGFCIRPGSLPGS